MEDRGARWQSRARNPRPDQRRATGKREDERPQACLGDGHDRRLEGMELIRRARDPARRRLRRMPMLTRKGEEVEQEFRNLRSVMEQAVLTWVCIQEPF